MLPIKSNTISSGCTPTSSDCVIWQGPNIPCINLCTGDSISDVTYKIAEKLCAIQGVYDLTPLQLSDLATFCTTIAGPPTGANKTLLAVLDYIVKKVVCVNAKVDGIVPGTSYTEPILGLPSCLQYTDPATQQQITQLIHNQYTLRLANQFCSLKTTVDNHTTILTNHRTRIEILEAKTSPALPEVTPNCSYPGLPADRPAAMNLLLDAVEADLCNLRQVVGTNPQLVAAAGQLNTALCPTITNLNTAQSLLKGAGSTMAGAYASLGWNSTVGNIAQSIQNLWITVLDMRCVVNDLRNCCGQNDCSKFILDFDVSTDNTRNNVTINFFGKSILPGTGWSNGTGSQISIITITDGVNTITTQPVDFIALVSNSAGLTIPVVGVTNALNPSRSYKVSANITIIKDTTVCNKPKEVISYPPCSSIASVIQAQVVVQP